MELQQVVNVDPAQISAGHLADDLVNVNSGHSGVGACNCGAVHIGVDDGVVVVNNTGIHGAVDNGSQIHVVQVDPACITAAPGHVLGNGGLVNYQSLTVLQSSGLGCSGRGSCTDIDFVGTNDLAGVTVTGSVVHKAAGAAAVTQDDLVGNRILLNRSLNNDGTLRHVVQTDPAGTLGGFDTAPHLVLDDIQCGDIDLITLSFDPEKMEYRSSYASDDISSQNNNRGNYSMGRYWQEVIFNYEDCRATDPVPFDGDDRFGEVLVAVRVEPTADGEAAHSATLKHTGGKENFEVRVEDTVTLP